MSKKVGLLYDNISHNTGDEAIGLSELKILRDIGARFEVLFPGHFNVADYDTIIIGGGHILRPRNDFFYDKFRVYGRHILNSVGILGKPNDLRYLEDYKYVSVRSNGDRDKLSYLNKKVHVVPCSTMLLEDEEGFSITPKKRSIGIHLLPGILGVNNEKDFINWASSLPYTIYFIPITHYNQDFLYMQRLSAGIRNSIMLPLLKPLEIFTLMGRIDHMISCSLHGAIFSYAHNTPFVMLDYDDKMRFFMEDRGLQQYLFRDFKGMKDTFNGLHEAAPDYSASISRDHKVLYKHVDRLKELLPENGVPVLPDGRAGDEIRMNQYFHDLLSYATTLEARVNRLETTMALPLRIDSIYRSLDRKLHYGAARMKGDILRRISWPSKLKKARSKN